MYRKKKKRGVWGRGSVFFFFFQSSLNFGRPTRIPSFFLSGMIFIFGHDLLNWNIFIFRGGIQEIWPRWDFSLTLIFFILKKKKWNVILRVCLYKNIWCAAPLGRKKEKGPYVLFRGRGGDRPWLTLEEGNSIRTRKKKGNVYLYRIFLFFCFLFLKREKWSSLPWLKVTIDTRTLLKKSTGKISTQKWWTWFSPNLMSICRQQEENEEKTRKTARDKFCDNFYYILLSVFCFFLNASHFFFFFSNIKMRFHRKCSTSVHQLSPTREAVGPSVFFLLLLPMR